MGIGQILYQLLIRPLELIFEVVYGYSKVLLGNSGLSVFALSLCVNLLLLPLYNRADAIQEEEREKEKGLEHWVSHIKKTFSGNEQFMMLQTYYRQNNYKPYYVLKGLLPLLLQVPFFIAAYHFLSNLTELAGTPFGPIKNLGAPDGMLLIGGIRLNLLPILMTLINILSGSLYTKGFRLKDKLQLYAMALMFLLLLYDSPAGLVLYWTLNNLFSLLKNLLRKFPAAKRILKILLLALCLAGAVYIWLFFPGATLKKKIIFGGALLLAAGLFLLNLMGRRLPGAERIPQAGKTEGLAFLLGAGCLVLLLGLLIPSAVVRSAPGEFISLSGFYSPNRHVLNALLLAAGMFLIWPGVFYGLASKKGRWLIGLLAVCLAAAAVIDYMFFGVNLGALTPDLRYEIYPEFSRGQILLNLGVIAAVVLLLSLIWHKKCKILPPLLAALLLAFSGMGMINVVQVRGEAGSLKEIAAAAQQETMRIPLSRQGKNVVVIMLDRAIGPYFPYIIEELPQLKEQLAGFTYYPRTLSFGAHTNVAAPALYGGYEYTPEELNKRSGELLKDKHNESLKVMPVIFSRAGYDVTVVDPPYANYHDLVDLSIYDGYPGIKGYVQEWGASLEEDPFAEERDRLWPRNFFCYSVMKAAPLMLQHTLYQRGTYFEPNGVEGLNQTEESISRARGNRMHFMKAYAVLDTLAEHTQIQEGGNTFLMLTNSTAHEQQLLKAPEYEPADVVDNTGYDAAHAGRFSLNGRTLHITDYLKMAHYHVNAAALLRLGKWMDFLRQEGIYDNTRILIVADHGSAQNTLEGTMFGEDKNDDIMFYNPLLLVKDFDSRGSLITDQAFMTNADTPSLSLEGLIKDPVNPFTGAVISADKKKEPFQLVFTSHEYEIETNNGSTFLPGAWYAVTEDFLSPSGWRFLDIH